MQSSSSVPVALVFWAVLLGSLFGNFTGVSLSFWMMKESAKSEARQQEKELNRKLKGLKPSFDELLNK